MVEQNEEGQPVGDVIDPPWRPRSRPEPVTLGGTYVTLEPLADAHAADLHRALCGPADRSLWTYRPVGPPETAEELAELNRGWPWVGGNVSWAVVPALPSGRPSGMTTFTRIEPVHGQVEVAGVIYARGVQRTPATTEATHLLMRYAFDDLGYRRFEWKCDSLNAPSRRAATRLGFAYEGTFRNHMVNRGRNRDTAWFCVTDTEWRTLRPVHERWLARDNFADDGTQRLSLGDLTRMWRTSPGAR